VRIVLQIGVLHDGDVAGHQPDGRANGRPFAAVAVVAESADAGILGGQSLQFLPRAVAGAVVDTTNSNSRSSGTASTRRMIVANVQRSLYSGIRTESLRIG